MTDDKKKVTAEDEILAGLAEFSKNLTNSIEQGSVSVRITDDKMKAFVKVAPPEDAVDVMDRNTVLDALAKNGVKYGVDYAALDDIFTFGSYNVDIEVAKGLPPSNGADAVIEYKFDTTGEAAQQLKEDEYGNVDFRTRNLANSVEEGSILAIKTPSLPGQPGMNIIGEELAPVLGKDIRLPIGQNVAASEDGLQVIASKGGQPILKDNKIAISPVYEVRGDVCFKSGNVDFNGSVIIRGNVLSDFIVKAADDLDIFGNIEKATIIAGGNIRITGGIYGAEEGHIKAGGSISIRSVESATLEAGESISIAQASRYSTLMAGEDIIISNPKGSIIGGKASSGHHFIVANLGAPSFTDTIIEIGVNPRLRRTYEELEQAIENHKMQLEKAVLTIKSIKDMQTAGQPITVEKMEMLKKLVPATHQLKATMESDSAKLNFLKDKMKSLQAGRVKVMYKTYPGVKFFALNANMPVQREINHSSFYEQNSQIIVGPY